jgi:excisionase family DNA binding protein
MTPFPSQTTTTQHTFGAPGALLTPSEVASMFRVDPKTVTRWARAGKLSAVRTLGGHRRYSEAEVRSLLAGVPRPRTAQD